MMSATKSAIAAKVIELSKEFAEAGLVLEPTGNNTGPQLDKIEKVWDMQGEPYCAMGQYWVMAKAYCMVNGIKYNDDPKSGDYCVKVFGALRDKISEELLYFSPACVNMITAAQKRKTWHNFNSHESKHLLLPGDYLFYDFSSNHHKPERHIEVVIANNLPTISTVGWNTRPAKDDPSGQTNDPKGGGGCFAKQRNPDSGVILGYIRWL